MRINHNLNKSEINLIIFSLQKALASLIFDKEHSEFYDLYEEYDKEVTEYKSLIQKLSDAVYKGDM